MIIYKEKRAKSWDSLNNLYLFHLLWGYIRENLGTARTSTWPRGYLIRNQSKTPVVGGVQLVYDQEFPLGSKLHYILPEGSEKRKDLVRVFWVGQFRLLAGRTVSGEKSRLYNGGGWSLEAAQSLGGLRIAETVQEKWRKSGWGKVGGQGSKPRNMGRLWWPNQSWGNWVGKCFVWDSGKFFMSIPW